MLEFILDTILIFFTYGFFGWIWECLYVSLKDGKLANRGFLIGPIIPIYGFGGTTIYLLYYFCDRKFSVFNLSYIFIAGLLVATVLEYLTSFFLEKFFDAKWWDYQGEILNIKGRVCLKASIFWGLLTIVFTQFVNPFFESEYSLINFDLKVAIVSSLSTTIVIDTFATIFALINLKAKINAIVEVENIKLSNAKEKLEEIPNSYKEFIESTKERMYKETSFIENRFLKAFPKLKFKSIEKQNVLDKFREFIKKK